jgi:hypothetical protein
MNIKNITLATIAFVASFGLQAQTGMSTAQDPATQEQRTIARSKELATHLGLDQEQTDRMIKADLSYVEAMTALRAGSTDREVIRQKGEGISREHDATLRNIMTPEQFAKLLESRQTRSVEGKGKMQELQTKPAE